MQHSQPIVFLSYAKEDRRRVLNIYRGLRRAGLNPWMDAPPKPWQKEGIRPGCEWDTEIRERIGQAKVILLFLSGQSVTKRGYVQREYRLALNLALERPPGSISLVPILLEPCTVPDLRVDTASLRQFQWHLQYRSSLSELVQLVRDIVAPQPVEVPQPNLVTEPRRPSDSRGIFAVLESIQNDSDQAAGALTKCISGILRANIEDAQRSAWSAKIEPNDVNLRGATDALESIDDPAIAIGCALLLAEAYNRRTIAANARTQLRRWLSHVVPEVGAVGAVLLAQSKRPPSDVLAWLQAYSENPVRMKGGQALLRHLITPFMSLARLTEHAPGFVWQVFTNDPHLAGMELHHASFNDAPHRFEKLVHHHDWRIRETAAAVWGADRRIAVKQKLNILADVEPRVRFRGLEGLLHATNGDADLTLIIDTLKKQPEARCESRCFCTRAINDGKAVLAILEDQVGDAPETSSFSFSSMACEAMEALDPILLVLRGVVAVGDYHGTFKAPFSWYYGSATEVPIWIRDSSIVRRIELGAMDAFKAEFGLKEGPGKSSDATK